MNAIQESLSGVRRTLQQVPLLFLMLLALFLATATLWITAYWPVALFEIGIFVIAAVAVVLGRAPLPGTSYPLFALGFVLLWGCLQRVTGSTINGFATERAATQWMTWVAVYYVGVSLLREQRVARVIREMMVWFALAIAVWAILQAYLSPGTVLGLFPTGYRDFVMGPIVYHSHFAALIESILPIALYLALGSNKHFYRWVCVSAVLFTSVVVSASRGGLLLTSAEIVAVLGLYHRQKPQGFRRTGLLALALAGAATLLILIVGFGTVSERFYAEPLARGRFEFAVSTLHMIAARPFLGWGLGCWAAVYPAFASFDPGAIVNQAHCDWLQWTAEGGLPVGVAMLSLALWSIRPAVRSVWGIGVIAVLIHAGFDYPFSRPAIGAWPILILAMTVVEQASGAERVRTHTEA